jgi:hypothetical protein
LLHASEVVQVQGPQHRAWSRPTEARFSVFCEASRSRMGRACWSPADQVPRPGLFRDAR